jgi:hypothetical protein
VAISQSGISTDTCPSQSGGSNEIKIFDLWEFFFNTFSLFQSDFSQSGRLFSTHPLKINDPGPLWDFDTFQPRRDQWPLAPFLINGRYSTSELRHFQTLLLCILPEYFHLEIHNLSPISLLELWSRFTLGLRLSGLQEFQLSTETLELFFLKSLSNDTCLLLANRRDPLWPFGSSALRASNFQTSTLSFLPKCIHPKIMIYQHVPLLSINDQDLLWLFTQSPQTYATCPLDPMAEIYFGSTEFSNLNFLLPSKCTDICHVSL